MANIPQSPELVDWPIEKHHLIRSFWHTCLSGNSEPDDTKEIELDPPKATLQKPGRTRPKQREVRINSSNNHEMASYPLANYPPPPKLI